MSMISRDDRKNERGIKKFIRSFSYPISGFRYAYKNEQNLMVDLGVTIIIVILGILLKLNTTEWAIIVITIGLVISLELVNTSIEAVVDLVTDKYHPLAKVAKDTSSAAVLILAVVSVIEGLIIFLPKIISLL